MAKCKEVRVGALREALLPNARWQLAAAAEGIMKLDVAAQRPRFGAGQAIDLVGEHFGITAVAARELPSDRDQNFHLVTGGGAAYVLKIAGAAESQAVLDLQNRALLHLARAPAVAPYVPQLRPTAAGRLMAAVDGAGGRRHFLRLLVHLPGVPLVAINPQPRALLAGSGRLLGLLDEALLDFQHPAMARRLHWDLAHALETLAHYGRYIRQPQKRALLERFREQYARQVAPLLPALRRSVIHSDGNDHNILVSAGDTAPRRVVGLIDFGDMVRSATVFEPAIAAAYLMLDKDDPAAAAAAVVAGYHAVLPLREEEIALLPLLAAMRLCISVALSAYQQAQEPHNDYLSVSERPAWALLARLAQMPPGALQERLRAACERAPRGA